MRKARYIYSFIILFGSNFYLAYNNDGHLLTFSLIYVILLCSHIILLFLFCSFSLVPSSSPNGVLLHSCPIVMCIFILDVHLSTVNCRFLTWEEICVIFCFFPSLLLDVHSFSFRPLLPETLFSCHINVYVNFYIKK